MWMQSNLANTYMLVKVDTMNTGRFLNLCRNNEIYFWNICKTEYGFDAKITRTDFLKIKDICRRTKTRVRIIKRKGIRFALFRYRKHYSFLAGIMIAFILIYVCSLFVWDISFTGNVQYTDSTLIKYLKTMGIYPGIKVRDINCDDIESSIRNTYDNVTWVSAQISGTRLIIHLKESDGMKVAVTDATQPSDIIASESGVVEKIITRSGMPVVSKGDTVEKGQVLVTGVVEKKDDSGNVTGHIYTNSDADIVINTSVDYNDELVIEHDFKSYTGREIEKNIIGIGDTGCEFGISFKNFKEYDVMTSVNNVYLTKNFCLPVSYGKKVYAEYEVKTASYTQEEASQILNDRLNLYMKKLMENGVQILENSVKMDSDGIKYFFRGNLDVNMPAYEYSQISTEKIQEIENSNKTDKNNMKESTGSN